MKIVIYKSYEKRSVVYDNYGDNYDEVWHNFKAIEQVKEVTKEEVQILKQAINYFNNKANKNYSLGMLEIVEDEEIELLLTDFKAYEKKELEKQKKLEKEKLEKEQLSKQKAEVRKNERLVKKFSKELNLSPDQVREMLKK